MTSTLSSFRTLSDRDLLAQLERAVGQERQTTAHLIALLMEVDARKLYATQSCSSLFTYCVQVLHFSEHAAYLRIEAARAARRFPAILERLGQGSLHLTAVSLLAPHLTVANHVEVLDAARHKSKRDETRPGSRHIPASVKREVWHRDGGRCACRGEQGRCTETGFLEFHHVVPYAEGGATTRENLELRCRTHNVYEAERLFARTARSFLSREMRAEYGMGPPTRSGPSPIA